MGGRERLIANTPVLTLQTPPVHPAWGNSCAHACSHDDADAGQTLYQLMPEHGGLYGPRVANATEFNRPHCTQEFMDYFLAKATEVVDQYHPDLVYFGTNAMYVIIRATPVALVTVEAWSR